LPGFIFVLEPPALSEFDGSLRVWDLVAKHTVGLLKGNGCT
jgi:hypothetical protein